MPKIALWINALEKTIYDSLSDNIVVINKAGDIRYVNEAWRQFAEDNRCSVSGNWLTYNYLAECQRAIDGDDQLAVQAKHGICQVLEGTLDSFYMEYPCQSPLTQKWFLMRVAALKRFSTELFLIRHIDISERKLAEDLIKEKKRAIIAAIPDIMFLHDKKGNYLESLSNDPSLLLLPIEHIIGKNPADILPAPLAAKVLAHIDKVLHGSQQAQFEYDIDIRGQTKSFDARFVRCRSDQVVSILHDITERKAVEKELDEMRRHYSAVVEDQTELICRFTPDTTLTFVNQAYCNFFGLPKSELLGKQFLPFIPEKERPMVLKTLQALSRHAPTASYVHSVYDQFQQLHLQEWIDRAIFNNNGDIVEYQSVGRDVTERIEAEEKLALELERSKALQKQIETKNADLEKSNATLSMMLDYARKAEIDIQERVVANLRFNIISLLELLKKQNLPTNAQALIDVLESNAQNLAQPLARKLDSLFLGLTTREMQIANFIEQGKTTKEIMAVLNLSSQTVESHRNNLRKKLGLRHKKINLRTYLNAEFHE